MIERTPQEVIPEGFFMSGSSFTQSRRYCGDSVVSSLGNIARLTTRTLFAKSSQRFLKIGPHYLPVSKGIKPAHIERLIMKNTRTAVAALLIAGFALTSTTASFAVDTTKADRVAARTAFKAQMDAFKAAAATRHTAADAARATIDAARATAKAAKAAATSADQKAAAKAAFEAARTAAKATVPAKPAKPAKPAILVKTKPATTPAP
jgi:hypothetical protein